MTDTENKKAEAKKFNLIAALSGRTHPEVEVPVFLDEALMFEFSKVSRAADEDPVNEDKQLARDKVMDLLKEFMLTVTLRGVDRHVLEAIEEEVLEEFPIKYNMIGEEIPNRHRAEAFASRWWNIYITKIETPDGSVLIPEPEDIKAFRGQAPQAAIDAVEDGINALRNGPAQAYQRMVKDPAFLSQP